ncbi:sigma-70 family RNA polymerase sigma factor [Actinoplanes sp. LDG1-06]|uniref:Sigma-70 family RNA polymerase sigma factor n=1 Tax=Paractinoplanes ovalisporus TaxID=2810368 RepID=A0ABS2AUK4_9ACTN|nr:sigma-70 family RNA polymerase sigma factor [Actinoplanes ovalisporus]MBM2622896.1 sigma-70 family RNA polymerase sigma factor [Actinoplanes ovalisporus]
MDHDDTAEQRFRALHAATYIDLLRFVKRRIPDDDADDVVSAAYLVAWQRLGSGPPPRDARPWLFGIARNILANQSRRRLRRGVVDVRMVADAAEADRAPGVDARIDLVRAWWALSAADREVLALVAFDGLTDVQAADVLGCRRATFRMRLNRARRRLRLALEPATDLPPAVESWSRA